MQTEELVLEGGLFSGLEAEAKLNELLDEFYGNHLREEEKAPRDKGTGAAARRVTQHFFVVPPGLERAANLERAAKKKQTLHQPAPPAPP